MEPEIARRCSDCGASVRGHASFCPQCGKTLRSAGSISESPEQPSRRITDPGRTASTVGPQEERTPPLTVAPAKESLGTAATAGDNHRRTDVADSRASLGGAAGVGGDDDAARSKRQRVTAAARDVVEEKLSPRVEKLRHASNVMLEEAAYDPSLRFVLVAIIILLLSLLLLLLNYLIG
ncbi:MAG TPA: zinc ribbon domain-containing protein [Pyrinomonadaceae bacterium]|nr:zinc ribbon domain-containing protein [Pyrinomonadaceae bacterium]